MNELLTSVCNETTDNHDNSLSKAEEFSSTPKTVTPSGVINTVAATFCTTKQVDQRKFSSQKYELKHRWLYYSHSNNDYMCKFCELFEIYILICYVVMTLLMYYQGLKFFLGMPKPRAF